MQRSSWIKKKTYAKKEYLNENSTIVGNICYCCEERLLNYDKLDDNLDIDADSGREETPVIVDDDVMLYQIFYDKLQQLQQQQQQTQQQTHIKHSLSSDCDTEVIEVQTSRESTPNKNLCQQKILAVIDLADDNSNAAQETLMPTTTSFTTPNKKRKKCKNYNDNELVVLAKLNLVSSDSEVDEIYPPNKIHASVYQQQQLPKVEILEKTEVFDMQDVKCPICILKFVCNQSLVHHMRIRHRSNELETQLHERMRHAQDSALTIRLCYQSRDMYFECQLCGRIDCTFKEHNQHVIAKHSAELRSLKDPLLHRLYCPVCQHNCGTLYVKLCRHILDAHKYTEYKLYLQEIRTAKQTEVQRVALKDLQKTARLFKLNKRTNLYIQCILCKNISNGIASHRQHIAKKHQNFIEEKEEEVVEKEAVVKIKELPKLIDKLRKREKKQRQVVIVKPIEDKQIATTKTTIIKRKRKKVQSSFSYIKQLWPQEYHCHLCGEKFKGFCTLNLHYMHMHNFHEFYACSVCKQFFMHNTMLMEHMKLHGMAQRRKRISGSCLTLDENSNATKANCCISNKMLFNNINNNNNSTKLNNITKETDMNTTPIWLKELMVMHNKRLTNTVDNNVNKDVVEGKVELALSSGLNLMKPNTATLEQTSYYRRTKYHIPENVHKLKNIKH